MDTSFPKEDHISFPLEFEGLLPDANVSEAGGLGEVADDLNAPDYATDDFRMYCFKVVRCSKRYVHDWRTCPFSHPTENARRRDPRDHHYLPIPCPEYKKSSICLLGDACPYAHGVYECWLHPSKYKTQLCKDGEGCRRPVCFFAHNSNEVRPPRTDLHPSTEVLELCERKRSLPSVGGYGVRPEQSLSSPKHCRNLLRARSTPAAALSSRSSPPASPPRRSGVLPQLLADSLAPASGCQEVSPGSCSPNSARSSTDGEATGVAQPLSSIEGHSAEQDVVPSVPRMSNALARKLGLTRQRSLRATLSVGSTSSDKPLQSASSLPLPKRQVPDWPTTPTRNLNSDWLGSSSGMSQAFSQSQQQQQQQLQHTLNLLMQQTNQEGQLTASADLSMPGMAPCLPVGVPDVGAQNLQSLLSLLGSLNLGSGVDAMSAPSTPLRYCGGAFGSPSGVGMPSPWNNCVDVAATSAVPTPAGEKYYLPQELQAIFNSHSDLY